MHHRVSLLFVLLAAGISVATAINTEQGRLGCFKDTHERVWKFWKNTHEKNSPRFCKNMCQDFKYAGMEAGNHCMCGNQVPPKPLPDSRCNSPCLGDPRQTCGGGWAVEVFTVKPKPALFGKPVGCFQDAADRVWKNGVIKLQANTPQRCINSCRGFKYAGLESGAFCMCGDTLPATPLHKARCQTPCTGLVGKTCGGPWALEVFKISKKHDLVQEDGYKQHGDLGIYKLYTQRKTWGKAWQQCEDDDAHLLIINSEEEANFVRSLFAHVPSETRMHAGFHNLLRKGTYKTLFGTSLTLAGYNVWSKQYPKIPSHLKHCGSVDVLARLAQIDGNCVTKAMFVCEKKSTSPDVEVGVKQIDFREALEAEEELEFGEETVFEV